MKEEKKRVAKFATGVNDADLVAGPLQALGRPDRIHSFVDPNCRAVRQETYAKCVSTDSTKDILLPRIQRTILNIALPVVAAGRTRPSQ